MHFLFRLAYSSLFIFLVSFFVLGIACGYFLPLPEQSLSLLTLFAVPAAFFFIFWAVFWGTIRYSSPPALSCLLSLSRPLLLLSAAAVAFFLGVIHISQAMQPPSSPHHLYNRIPERKEAVCIGIMRTMAQVRRTECGITSGTVIDCKWLSLRGNERPKAHFIPTKGKILLRIEGEWDTSIVPGDTVLFRTHLKRPRSYHSPAAFDYGQHLARQGIWLTGFISKPLFLRKIQTKIAAPPLSRLFYAVEGLRSRISLILYEKIPQYAPLYAAILLGEKSGITDTLYEAFARCGILHILTISGIHLTILFLLLHALFSLLFCRCNLLMLRFSHIITAHTLTALCTLPFLFAYTLLAGIKPPVLRALIMSCVLVFSFISRGRAAGGTLLAFAALLILLINPHQLFTASFQLSFTAVAVIFFLLPYLQWAEKRLRLFFSSKRVRRKRGRSSRPSSLRAALAAILPPFAAASLFSLGITLFTAPISVYHFHRLSFIGAGVTLIVEPLICLWALPCGILALPFLFSGVGILERIGGFFLELGGLGLGASEKLILSLAKLPNVWSWFSLSQPWFWLGILSLYGGIILLVIGRQFFAANSAADYNAGREKSCRRFLRKSGLLSLFLSLLFFLLPTLFTDWPGKSSGRIAFLDVGQGSATVIERRGSDERYCALIDGGGVSFTGTSVGRRVIAPYLWQRGIPRLDDILLTHSDSDHSSGLPFILDAFRPQRIFVRNSGEEHPRLEAIRRRFKGRLEQPEEGENIYQQEDFSLQVLHNFGAPQGGNSDRNAANRGLIIRAKMDGFTLLLPGDIDREAEKILLEKKLPGKTNLLLAAHHGSKTSNSINFLTALSPEIIIVSAGKNRGLYPSKGLTAICEKKGIPLYSTADFGTMELEFQDGEIRLYSYQKERGNNEERDNPLRRYERVLLYRKEIKGNAVVER